MPHTPNLFPTLQVDYKLAIIGDSPCEQDCMVRKPFSDYTGARVTTALRNLNGAVSGVFLGNLCQYRPPDNFYGNFASDSDEIVTSKAILRAQLLEFNPNCILLTGHAGLKAAGFSVPKSKNSNLLLRGSILKCEDPSSPFFGFKVVPTVNLPDINKDYSLLPLLVFDVKRALEESFSKEINLPVRNITLNLSSRQIIERLEAITSGVIALDIEGGVKENQKISCLSIATSASDVFIIPILDFGKQEQHSILMALSRVLYDTNVKKILQNSLYDNFCLTWAWKMPIRNVAFDIMLSSMEINPELPKGLDFQASIYTREPYYKNERKSSDKETFYSYCCKDSAVTFEIAQVHSRLLSGKQKEHYHFNVSLLPAFLYMELRGMRYDKSLATKRLAEIEVEMAAVKHKFDTAAGMSINPNTGNGPNSLANILYRKLGFPPQYKKEHGRKTTSLSADIEALLNLVKSSPQGGIIENILLWRALESQRRQLSIACDADGRMRSSYNVVGTETMRVVNSASPTGTGANLTTIMKKYRDLYLADEGYEFFQVDLSGADSWTVGAHCARMGDPTLLDDLKTKLKPAKIVALMYLEGQSVGSLDRDTLISKLPKVPEDNWLYPTCKAVVHGSSYDMKPPTMSKNILLRSWKDSGIPQYIPPKDCEALQKLFLNGRYRAIVNWQEWVKWELKRSVNGKPNKKLEAASGTTRLFLGREDDPVVVREALAHEPQSNTTYATNLALYRLWTDKENRTSDGNLRIQPLHQVHDALCGQFKTSEREWALEKIKSYFNNELIIAGQKITIPFDGGYGPDWKNTKTKI